MDSASIGGFGTTCDTLGVEGTGAMVSDESLLNFRILPWKLMVSPGMYTRRLPWSFAYDIVQQDMHFQKGDINIPPPPISQ